MRNCKECQQELTPEAEHPKSGGVCIKCANMKSIKYKAKRKETGTGNRICSAHCGNKPTGRNGICDECRVLIVDPSKKDIVIASCKESCTHSPLRDRKCLECKKDKLCCEFPKVNTSKCRQCVNERKQEKRAEKKAEKKIMDPPALVECPGFAGIRPRHTITISDRYASSSATYCTDCAKKITRLNTKKRKDHRDHDTLTQKRAKLSIPVTIPDDEAKALIQTHEKKEDDEKRAKKKRDNAAIFFRVLETFPQDMQSEHRQRLISIFESFCAPHQVELSRSNGPPRRHNDAPLGECKYPEYEHLLAGFTKEERVDFDSHLKSLVAEKRRNTPGSASYQKMKKTTKAKDAKRTEDFKKNRKLWERGLAQGDTIVEIWDSLRPDQREMTYKRTKRECQQEELRQRELTEKETKVAVEALSRVQGSMDDSGRIVDAKAHQEVIDALEGATTGKVYQEKRKRDPKDIATSKKSSKIYEARPERKLAKKQLRLDNPIRMRNYLNAYRVGNERVKEYNRQYWDKYKRTIPAIMARINRRPGVELKMNEAELKSFLDDPCFYCGLDPKLDSSLWFEFDRVDSKNPDYSVKNCVRACGICNHMKYQASVDDFTQGVRNVVMWQLMKEAGIYDLPTFYNSTAKLTYAELLRSASVKKLTVDLTLNHYRELTSTQCTYCGNSRRTGVDRIDSGKGYILDNVTSCCTRCNFMKCDMTVSEFLDACFSIVLNFNPDITDTHPEIFQLWQSLSPIFSPLALSQISPVRQSVLITNQRKDAKDECLEPSRLAEVCTPFPLALCKGTITQLRQYALSTDTRCSITDAELKEKKGPCFYCGIKRDAAVHDQKLGWALLDSDLPDYSTENTVACCSSCFSLSRNMKIAALKQHCYNVKLYQVGSKENQELIDYMLVSIPLPSQSLEDIKKDAKEKKVRCNITLEEYHKLQSQSCSHCGDPNGLKLIEIGNTGIRNGHSFRTCLTSCGRCWTLHDPDDRYYTHFKKIAERIAIRLGLSDLLPSLQIIPEFKQRQPGRPRNPSAPTTTYKSKICRKCENVNRIRRRKKLFVLARPYTESNKCGSCGNILNVENTYTHTRRT